MEEIAELRESMLSKKRFFQKHRRCPPRSLFSCLPAYLPEIDIKYRYAEYDEPTNETRAQAD